MAGRRPPERSGLNSCSPVHTTTNISRRRRRAVGFPPRQRSWVAWDEFFAHFGWACSHAVQTVVAHIKDLLTWKPPNHAILTERQRGASSVWPTSGRSAPAFGPRPSFHAQTPSN